MPVIKNQNYVNPRFLLGGHVQTIVPSLLRRVPTLAFDSERITTPDGDFLELDWLKCNSKKLVIISHGLEGHSRRPYMVGMARFFFEQGYDVVNWTFRGCGAEPNLKPIFYHSGATYDLDTVVRHAAEGYSDVYLIGFSLGGNLTLKYLGEDFASLSRIKKAVAISVPLDLGSSCDKIGQRDNRLYMYRFLRTLKAKILAKASRFPHEINTGLLNKVNTLRDFDEYFTGPLHGFDGAEHYYTSCSSLGFLNRIQIPVLILNAQNDPFLSKDCFPYELGEGLPLVHMEFPRYGGHVGFSPASRGMPFWSEKRAFDFIHFNL